ncbi:hypothetical protein ATZ36_14345 [Candidatus Endomicrobiellum trichonymphae]|uniref:Uncharacterized protein n=1 Tax=Endomicrobium trichonymphae TaxID=1408204 RepID=A0A1E5IN24_ENDTX|nr:hypothetical protein ATZ36_14345 [Candidatus Endomicrobium trichonymphae]
MNKRKRDWMLRGLCPLNMTEKWFFCRKRSRFRMTLSRWSRQEKVFSLYERTSVSLIAFPVNDREGDIFRC